MTLSIEMAPACLSPCAGPTGTWLDRPLTVDVMGTTVTFVMAARAASRAAARRRISRSSAWPTRAAPAYAGGPARRKGGRRISFTPGSAPFSS